MLDQVATKSRVSEASRPLAPPAARAQRGAPDISGHYFSVFNESLAVCTSNGSLVTAFSGQGALHGLAFGAWNEATARWEGLVADAGDRSGGGTAPFHWVAGARGGLSGEWTVYNRTWTAGYEVVDNVTIIPPWQAHRSEGIEAEADAMGGGRLSLAHLCGLIAHAQVGGIYISRTSRVHLAYISRISRVHLPYTRWTAGSQRLAAPASSRACRGCTPRRTSPC